MSIPAPDEALRRELAEARADRQALTKALTGLTCNGSEFFIRRGDEYVADIEACVAWIRRSRESQQAAVKSALAKRGEAEARIAALQADVARLEAENSRKDEASSYKEQLDRFAAAQATKKLKAENEELRAALKPFASLRFSFDGFSCDPATLVFQGREYGEWWSDHHHALQQMINAARAALSAKIDEARHG